MHIFAEFVYCKIEFHCLWSNMLQFICFDLRANSTVSCSYLIPNNWIFRCVVVWKLKCIHCSTISSQSVYNLSSFDKGRKVHSRLLCWQVFVIRSYVQISIKDFQVALVARKSLISIGNIQLVKPQRSRIVNNFFVYGLLNVLLNLRIVNSVSPSNVNNTLDTYFEFSSH